VSLEGFERAGECVSSIDDNEADEQVAGSVKSIFRNSIWPQPLRNGPIPTARCVSTQNEDHEKQGKEQKSRLFGQLGSAHDNGRKDQPRP
jgi:hypothetical protein